MTWWKIWRTSPPQPAKVVEPRPSADELAGIRTAAAGLMFPSESDAPFEPFLWDAAAPGQSARDAVAKRNPQGAPLKVVPADAFFAELELSDEGDRFKALHRALTAQFHGLTVVRVGEVKVEIYAIGLTRAGRWAGVRTTSVET